MVWCGVVCVCVCVVMCLCMYARACVYVFPCVHVIITTIIIPFFRVTIKYTMLERHTQW